MIYERAYCRSSRVFSWQTPITVSRRGEYTRDTEPVPELKSTSQRLPRLEPGEVAGSSPARCW